MALTRRSFLQSTAGAAMASVVPVRGLRLQPQGAAPASAARIQLIRNATCRIRYGGRSILLDPYLSDAGAGPAINNTPNPRPNPLGPLPMPAAQVVAGIDATLLTHTHNDHWDAVARDLLPKGSVLFAQPADTPRVTQAGFTGVRAVETDASWDGTTIVRTGAQHGRGDVGRRMGAVSGYVLKRSGAPTVYIAGDTVWCPEVEAAIGTHRPDVIVVNAGAAQFLEGGVITMDVDDVVKVCGAAPQATVVAVHMETVNHCLLTREGLRAALDRAGVRTKVLIPRDGEEIPLG
jgi:L-ascorbate metabolism protein UlaG (beta-lactamase superfamily)